MSIFRLYPKLETKPIYDICVKKNGEGGGYGLVEADFLYCFICAKHPKRILQVGCGVSTAVIMLAAENPTYSPEIVCVDPYPTPFLVQSGKEGRIRLIQEKAQMVDMKEFTGLDHNDLLFIDSTHTVKPGSEVNKIILEVLPRLKNGTWVHFHDIHFPYDYSRYFLTTELFFSNESVLLHSFLINNNKCTLRVSLSMLHYADPASLRKLLPNYRPSKNCFGLNASEGHFPSSAYLEIVESCKPQK